MIGIKLPFCLSWFCPVESTAGTEAPLPAASSTQLFFYFELRGERGTAARMHMQLKEYRSWEWKSKSKWMHIWWHTLALSAWSKSRLADNSFWSCTSLQKYNRGEVSHLIVCSEKLRGQIHFAIMNFETLFRQGLKDRNWTLQSEVITNYCRVGCLHCRNGDEMKNGHVQVLKAESDCKWVTSNWYQCTHAQINCGCFPCALQLNNNRLWSVLQYRRMVNWCGQFIHS